MMNSSVKVIVKVIVKVKVKVKVMFDREELIVFRCQKKSCMLYPMGSLHGQRLRR
ncbi:hypothetical protein D3C84_725680 [compost metagenome]